MENEEITQNNRAILEALQAQNAALSQLVKHLIIPNPEPIGEFIKVTNPNIYSSMTFESFNEEIETFKSYKERLENFFELKKLQGDSSEIKSIKARILINALGAKYYSLLSSLTAPDLPSTKDYETLTKLLEEQLCPQTNVQTERHKFLSREQATDETLAQYIAALKQLSMTSKWNCEEQNCRKPVKSILQAQFVRGLRDVDIREQILQQGDNISFEKTVEIALAIEAAKSQNKLYCPATDVKKISKSRVLNNISSSRTLKNKPCKYSKLFPEKFKKGNILEKLGLDNLCLRCGKNNHRATECRSQNLHCRSCNKPGHIDKVCISTQLRQSINQIQGTDLETTSDVDSEYECNQVRTIPINYNLGEPRDDPFMATIKIGGSTKQFEIDSGSQVTIISLAEFQSLKVNCELKPSKVKFRSYTNETFTPVGVARVPISYKQCKTYGNLYVVKGNYTPIIGRDWIRKLSIELTDVHLVKSSSSVSPHKNNIDSIKSELFNKYKDVFQSSVGVIPNFKCTLKLKENAKPIFLKPRPIPYALLDKTKREIETLVEQGVLEKVDHSAWGTPLVIVPKQDQSVRICADYKITLNPQLEDTHYPIPRIEDLLNKLNGGKYYCVLDLHKAYLHVQLEEESQMYAAVSTPWGTYKAKRLFMGITNAPKEFHKIIDQVVANLEGTIAYFDDFLIQGHSFEECYQRLEKCLQTLRKYGLHVNMSKCKLFQTEITYLGHRITSQGVSKCPDKIEAVTKAPRPKNVEEVRSFLGLALYYAKFIPNASAIIHPLTQLLKKDVKFKWDQKCETSFKRIKDEITSERVLTPYNPDCPVTLATDAGPCGLSAVLSHIINGEEKPIAFASRSLTKSELAYSQLDKEATAVYWGIKRFYQYLYGRKFQLIVDNKPLEQIFNPRKPMPVISAHRLLRYAQFLSAFDYEIKQRPSKEHSNADYFSRNPILLDIKMVNFLEDSYKINQMTLDTITDSSVITADTIRLETDRDKELFNLKKKLLTGEIRTPEFTLHSGIVMRGSRVFIPEKLRPAVLKELHSSHIGIVKMKNIARSLCYWPGIDAAIEHIVKSCKNCAEVKKNPVKVPPHIWEEPQENWQRLHVDYAGPFKDHYFFVVIDAKSKWLEVTMSSKAPTSTSTIHTLEDLFSRHGLPYTIVSDNASVFKSEEFTKFCRSNGIIQRFSAPNHPATNGLAERSVQNLKQKLKTMTEDKGSLKEKLNLFLFKYRSSPLSCGKSPAELFMNRALRTRLHLIRPLEKTIKAMPNHQQVRSLKAGDRVQARNYVGPILWKFGTVIKRLGKLHYIIQLDNQQQIKRHINQLIKTEVKATEVIPSRFPRLFQKYKEIQSTPRDSPSSSYGHSFQENLSSTSSASRITPETSSASHITPETSVSSPEIQNIGEDGEVQLTHNYYPFSRTSSSSDQQHVEQPSEIIQQTLPTISSIPLRRSTRVKKPLVTCSCCK